MALNYIIGRRVFHSGAEAAKRRKDVNAAIERCKLFMSEHAWLEKEAHFSSNFPNDIFDDLTHENWIILPYSLGYMVQDERIPLGATNSEVDFDQQVLKHLTHTHNFDADECKLLRGAYEDACISELVVGAKNLVLFPRYFANILFADLISARQKLLSRDMVFRLHKASVTFERIEWTKETAIILKADFIKEIV
jgi:hypothetical protein